jgi:hypothetical protein
MAVCKSVTIPGMTGHVRRNTHTGREMSARAFESYVIEQLRDQGAANDYLANIVSPEYWKAAEALTLEKEGTYPYPEAAEVPAIREAFDNFFQVVETKEDDQGNVALFSMSPIEIDQTDAEYASALMNVMAQHDDVYRTPVSFEDSFKGVMQDIIPQIEVAAEPEMAEVMKATYPDLQGMWYLTLPGDQGTAYVYEEPNRVWIDVSELKSGRGGGFRIYSAVANYAHNAGKVFDGDPAGLSNLGVLRRTEQMLSSALKFGTTRHLNPHPRQVSPDLAMADIARPLNWKTDQDQHNLVEMLKSSYHNILTVVPEVRDVVFNAENGQFERNGSPVSERQFSAMAADSVRRRSEAAGSDVRGRKAALAGPVYGSASLKRAALINTVVRGKGREKWRSLLAALNDQLRRGERGGLANTLYSNSTETRPSAGFSASGLQKTLRKAVGKRLADSIEVVQSAADLPVSSGLQSLAGSIDAVSAPAFRRWFNGSKVVDDNGKPLVVYRGEHGRQKGDSGGFQSRLGSISFGSREAANTYSTMPNNHADNVVEARVYPVYLRIENPVVNDSSDPFIDLSHIEKKLGREEAERIAIEHEGHLTNTNNWDEISDELGVSDVQSLIESHPDRLGDLYLDVYPVLDDRTFVQKAMKAGYDGAIHGGMGETSGETEYRVFSDTSVKSAIGNQGTFSSTNPDTRLSSAGSRIEGMFDPATGKVYLVADNIPSEDRAAWVAWHELWHRGVRSIDGRRGKLPGSQEGQALNQALSRAGLNKSVKQLADAIMRDRGMGEADRRIATEEALAEMNAADETGDYRAIEQRYGVKVPEGMRSGIRGHIDRFLDAVRRVLSKLTGRAPADVSNREAWQIVTGARAGYAGNAEGWAGGGLNSVAPDQMALEAETDGAIPEETGFRAMQRKLQDRFNRFTVVQDWLKEQGVKLSGGADVYRAEERMHGRIAAQLEDFRDKTVRPLVKRIRQAGSSMEQVAEFLHAQHARERNAQIAKVNKAMPDGGSGMTNAEADAVLAKYADDAEFQALANKLRGITDQSRQILVDAGIITEEMADAWQAAYQHYVPLKGGPESTFTGSTGKGLTSKARLNRALGHGEREGGEWIIENILADHERAVMLAEKNLVGRHLLQMALEVGNSELLTVAQPEKRGVLKDKKAYAIWHKGSVLGAFESKAEANRFITEKTNLQGLKVSDFAVEETREPDVVYMARPQLADNETQVYVKGHAIRIQLNDELLARAWNKLGDEAVGTILQHMRGLNRYLSQVYTGYNPEFLATNMVRDLFTGTANLTGEEGTAMAVRALARYPSTFGQLLAHHVAGRTSRLMEEYREDGGQTGAAWLSDLERVGDDVRNTFDDAMRLSEVARKSGKGRAATSAWRRLIGNLLGWMEHINAAGENAFRLATYSAMRDAGKSRSEAVNAAKNVTVNFNRKGEMGASLSAMYLFFNPAIQGTASIAHAHFKGKNKEQAWAMSAGMMAAGFMYALANAGADEEEWEGVPEWEKERHIMVKTSDGWAKIPLPYGHGWFWSTGRHMADLFTGDIDPEKASLKIAASFVEEFSIFGPVVNGGELEADNLLFLAPTVMQIPGAVAVNQSSMGREVYPEMDWDEGIPDHQKMYRNTQGTVPEIVTSWLNEASGGDAVKGGRVDVSPETLKYFWRTFTGGAGSFFSDSLNIPVMLAQDVRLDEIESRETPLLRRFYRDVDVQDSRTRYYNAIEESRTALGEFMRAKRMDKQNRDTELELTRKYGLGNLEAVKVGKMAERFSTLIRLKREAQIAAMLSDKPLGWRRAQVRILEREEAKLYDEVLEKMGL